MSASHPLVEYYARRAAEYDLVYLKPERQHDLRRLEAIVYQTCEGHDVLEAACGTGYWTRLIAQSARSVVGVDLGVEMLQRAQSRDYGQCPVRFVRADAYSLPVAPGAFSAAFCGFWWSHIPRQELCTFLSVLHRHLVPGGRVFAIDNQYVEGSSTPLSRRDVHGDTYQARLLRDGSRHEVLKNFPSEEDLRATLPSNASQVAYTALRYYWILRYELVGTASDGR